MYEQLMDRSKLSDRFINNTLHHFQDLCFGCDLSKVLQSSLEKKESTSEVCKTVTQRISSSPVVACAAAQQQCTQPAAGPAGRWVRPSSWSCAQRWERPRPLWEDRHVSKAGILSALGHAMACMWQVAGRAPVRRQDCGTSVATQWLKGTQFKIEI